MISAEISDRKVVERRRGRKKFFDAERREG